MAQKKLIEAPSGVDAAYWIPGEVAINFPGKIARVSVLGYLNASARQQGKAPLHAIHLEVTGAAFKVFEEQPVEKAARAWFDGHQAGQFDKAEPAADVEMPDPAAPAPPVNSNRRARRAK